MKYKTIIYLNSKKITIPLSKIFMLILLFSTIPTYADGEEYTRTFRCPKGFVKLLESKYEGTTLKELLSNAGANLDKEDQVLGPNGAGIIVRSSVKNLSAIEQIIDSNIHLLAKVNDPKLVEELLTKNAWDFRQIYIDRKPIGIINFNSNRTAKGIVDLRWAITKQSVLELRESTGELILTAFLSRYDAENTMILHLTSSPKLNLKATSVKRNKQEIPEVKKFKEEQLKKLTGLKKLTAKTMVDYFGRPLNLERFFYDPSKDPFVDPNDKASNNLKLFEITGFHYLGKNDTMYYFEIREGDYSTKDLEKVAISAIRRYPEDKIIWQSQEEQEKLKKKELQDEELQK